MVNNLTIKNKRPQSNTRTTRPRCSTCVSVRSALQLPGFGFRFSVFGVSGSYHWRSRSAGFSAITIAGRSVLSSPAPACSWPMFLGADISKVDELLLYNTTTCAQRPSCVQHGQCQTQRASCNRSTQGWHQEKEASIKDGCIRRDAPLDFRKGEVPRGEKMLESGADPASYISEHTLVYEAYHISGMGGSQPGRGRNFWVVGFGFRVSGTYHWSRRLAMPSQKVEDGCEAARAVYQGDSETAL